MTARQPQVLAPIQPLFVDILGVIDNLSKLQVDDEFHRANADSKISGPFAGLSIRHFNGQSPLMLTKDIAERESCGAACLRLTGSRFPTLSSAVDSLLQAPMLGEPLMRRKEAGCSER